MQMSRFVVLALACLIGYAPSSQGGELVVIESTDPKIEAGEVLDGNKSIDIAGEHSLVLISSSGKVISLAGPYQGIPDPSGSTSDDRLVSALSQLLGKKASPATALGVTRGLPKGPPPGRPDIWGIDVARVGKYCIRPDQPTMLWWASARSYSEVTLSSADDASDASQIKWKRGERARAWPKELLLLDGETYLARFWEDDPGERLTTILMPALPSDAHRAGWMAEHGCTSQALKVLSALGKGEL